jgi:radical SAM protein with 4Fe4S-binding SPASM domain
MGRYTADYRFGRLDRDDIAQVWTTHSVLRTIRDGIPGKLGGICGRCVARTACYGHCRIDNENATLESFFDPYVTCAQMEKRGRFPESRIVARSLKPVTSSA